MRCQSGCQLAAVFLAWGVQHSASLFMQQDTVQERRPTHPQKRLDPKKLVTHKARREVIWRTGALGNSCTMTCKARGEKCLEEPMKSANDKAKVFAAAKDANYTCDAEITTLRLSFPAIHYPGTQCSYTTTDYEDSCDIITSKPIMRLCACEGINAHGDPHLTNMIGESFDVMRTGVNTLLMLPRSRTKPQNTLLQVDASVEHPGDGTRCGGFFIVKLSIKGSLIGGENIELSTKGWNLKKDDAIAVKVGNKILRNAADVAAFATNGRYKMTLNDKRSNMTLKHPNNRFHFANFNLHFAGVDLEIGWSTGKKKPNSLNFRASHLMEFGKEWGGILGADDHSWVSTYEPECKKSDQYGEIAQLVQVESEEPWYATASLA